MNVKEYERISEMEHLVNLVERVTQNSLDYDVPKFYSSFMGFTIIYKLHYDDCGLLAQNFDECSSLLAEKYNKLNEDDLKEIETREKINDIVFNLMLELNTELPKDCISYTARNFAYDLDLTNTCLTDINFDFYAKALIMDCEDKFLYKGPVKRLKEHFSKKKEIRV